MKSSLRFLCKCVLLSHITWAGTNPPPQNVDKTPFDLKKEFSQIESEARQFLEKDFQEKFPLYKLGDQLRLANPKGIVDMGTLSRIEKDKITLNKSDQEKTIPFPKLQVFDRLRLDPAYRKKWIHLQARTEARKEIEAQGLSFPTPKHSIGGEHEQALAWADPLALYTTAKTYQKGVRKQKDTGYLFLFMYMSARQGYPDAKYILGRMYYKGIAVPKNKKLGLQFIASAYEAGHETAGKFLEARKISLQEAQKAAENHRQKSKKEYERYVKRVEAYNKAYAGRKKYRGRLKSKIGKD